MDVLLIVVKFFFFFFLKLWKIDYNFVINFMLNDEILDPNTFSVYACNESN